MKVDLIYSKNLSDKTGASTVMRLLNGCKSSFGKYGFELDAIAREHITKSNPEVSNAPNKINYSKGFKTKAIQLLANMARTRPSAALLLAYIQSIRAAQKIVRYAKKEVKTGDILFFHELYTAYYYLKFFGKNNPVVIVYHNDGCGNKLLEDRYQNFRGSYFDRLLNHMTEFVNQRADFIGFVSKCSLENFQKLNPAIAQERLFYAHNGIPSEPQIKRSHKLPIEIVCVATVIESKGQCFIIDALCKFKRNNEPFPNVHISIVGGGPLLPNLLSQVEENALGDMVTFHGASNNVKEHLAVADIFILPSTSEGLPMSILEAMSMSLPIVSTPNGGIPETVVDGETGLLISPSTEGVYKFLKEIENYDWVSMGEKSYQYFTENFSIENMVSAYSEIFKKIDDIENN